MIRSGIYQRKREYQNVVSENAYISRCETINIVYQRMHFMAHSYMMIPPLKEEI